jgi:hypothetical protein
MPKRFTGIRLLLIFVGINLVMFLMLVTSMTSAHPWLATVLPGQFETGVNSSGYWVFFALVLLVDALTVFIAGLALMLPAMFEGAPIDERRLTRHLVDRGGVSEEAKEAIFVSLREDAVNAYYQLVVGRMILLAGAIFLILAFFATSYVFTRALPDGAMFQTAVPARIADTAKGTKVTVTGYIPVKNSTIRADQIARFTADQVVAAVALNAPHIYGVRFVALSSNPKLPLFTHFLFAFRIFLIFTLLLTVLSLLRRPQRPKREKKTIESVEAKLEEVKA